MKTILISLFIVCMALVSCKVVDRLTTFNLEYSIESSIPKDNILTIPISVISPKQETEANVAFENNNTSAELVESITLSSLNISIESPESGNFDFLESIQVFINSDGLDELEIANRSAIPDGSKTLSLTVSTENLAEYIKQDEFNLKIKVVQDKPNNVDLNVVSDLKLKVKAKLLN